MSKISFKNIVLTLLLIILMPSCSQKRSSSKKSATPEQQTKTHTRSQKAKIAPQKQFTSLVDPKNKMSVVPEDELIHQHQMDQTTIMALAKAGSDLKKPHALEHHFVCDTKEQAKVIAEWGKANGFQVSKISEDKYEGRNYASFDLIKMIVPTVENVTANTTRMLQIAKKHAVEYDGWGCPVVE